MNEIKEHIKNLPNSYGQRPTRAGSLPASKHTRLFILLYSQKDFTTWFNHLISTLQVKLPFGLPSAIRSEPIISLYFPFTVMG